MKVAFIGHRKIKDPSALEKRLTDTVISLIERESADTFYFGSKSEFDDLCLEVVTSLMGRYPHVRRIYVRSMYECVDKSYEQYLLTLYDETFFPDEVKGAGALSYVVRNRVMIDESDLLVTYLDENYCERLRRNSGTKVAVEYATKKKKRIINVFEK